MKVMSVFSKLHIILVPLFIFNLFTLSAYSKNTKESEWSSNFGPVFLQQHGSQITGKYPKYHGKITGTLDHNSLSGNWIQKTSKIKCSHSIGGSNYWGTLTFNNITSSNFTGSWAYCDNKAGSGGKWHGQLVSGEPILPVSQTKNSPKLTKDSVHIMLQKKYQNSYNSEKAAWLQTDITCDGIDDYIIGWEDIVNPEHAGYHVTIIHNTSGQPEINDTLLRISDLKGGNEELPELCKINEYFKPELTLSPTDKDIMTHYKLPSNCKQAVAIDDGACDKVYLMWNPTTDSDNKAIFFRMN